MQFIDAPREYRHIVVGDEVVRTQTKLADDSWVRNHTTGARFVGRVTRRLNADRYDQAVTAVKALGLDFGAVDQIIDQDGRAYVLEVNTAMAMSPLTLDTVASALQSLISQRGHEPPQDLCHERMDNE